MQSKNLLILARELNISVIRLRSILLYMLNDLNVAADKLSTRDIYDVIKSIDRKNYYYTVPEDLCSILFEQKAESKSLIPIDQVVEENKIVPYTMREFINEQKVSGGTAVFLITIFLEKIFSPIPKKFTW